MAESSSPSGIPGLRGKTVAVFVRSNANVPILLSDCILETRGSRLFLAGTSQPSQKDLPEWTDGARRAVAWDAIEQYLLFETPDEYYARTHTSLAEDILELPQQPLFEMPQSTAGHPVEPSGIQMEPETPLDVGSIVLSYSQGRWWRAEVVAIEDDDLVTLHFPGWDSKWDVTVSKTELQVYLGESLEDGE